MQVTKQLPNYYFNRFLLEVAIATLEKGGAAARLDTYSLLPPLDVWSFPKYPARTSILPAEIDLVGALRDFVRANESYLREPDCWLGTWINPQNHCFYLDIVTSRPTLAEARQAALEASQREGRAIVAIYNSMRNETVYLEHEL